MFINNLGSMKCCGDGGLNRDWGGEENGGYVQ